ncbi:MAG: PQQ-binding-like beta-propeller repeat protein [Bryobacteraceae bacterium]
MIRAASVFLLMTAVCAVAADSASDRWPQFRGPAGSGVNDEQKSLPVEFGPGKKVAWRTELPSGHGSPCVWGDRIFVTSFDPAKKLLEVIAINRKDGKIVWRNAISAPEIEKVHEEGNPAASTPTTDGERVYVYLGSFGVIAYDFGGKVVWQHPLPLYTGPYGSGTSPVLAGDLVLVSRDYRPAPALIALNKKDGTLVWNATLTPVRFAHSASHSTPLIWKDEVVLNRPTRVSGHSLKDGHELWMVPTTSTGEASPTSDGETIFAAAFNMGSDPMAKVEKTPWSVALAKYDKNKDGKLSKEELPDFDLLYLRRVGVRDDIVGAHFTVKTFFGNNDRNKDGFLDEQEYDSVFARAETPPAENNGLMAIRPEGEGDISEKAVVWRERRGIPEVPAPMFYRGRAYMVANGGVLTAVDAKTGKLLFRGRVNAPGAYYASPVAGAGKIFVSSSEGVITVLSDGPEMKILSSNDLGERIYGTPALVDAHIYVRTSKALWAFGEK